MEIPNAVTELPMDQAYFNGFQLSVGAGDLTITLACDSDPVTVLHCSYSVAKTLAEVMSKALRDVEQKTGTPILTMTEILEKMKQGDEPNRGKV